MLRIAETQTREEETKHPLSSLCRLYKKWKGFKKTAEIGNLKKNPQKHEADQVWQQPVGEGRRGGWSDSRGFRPETWILLLRCCLTYRALRNYVFLIKNFKHQRLKEGEVWTVLEAILCKCLHQDNDCGCGPGVGHSYRWRQIESTGSKGATKGIMCPFKADQCPNQVRAI